MWSDCFLEITTKFFSCTLRTGVSRDSILCLENENLFCMSVLVRWALWPVLWLLININLRERKSMKWDLKHNHHWHYFLLASFPGFSTPPVFDYLQHVITGGVEGLGTRLTLLVLHSLQLHVVLFSVHVCSSCIHIYTVNFHLICGPQGFTCLNCSYLMENEMSTYIILFMTAHEIRHALCYFMEQNSTFPR